MPPKHRKGTPEWAWEESLLGDYYDFRWHEILDPLHEKMLLWKQGQLTHDDIDKAIHETHKETQSLGSFYNNHREYIISMAQLTERWFGPWLVEHPAPPGITLKHPPGEFSLEADPEEIG